MAAQAVIGNPFTFQARFLDANNDPYAPAVGPTITIFSFSTAGAKNVLVNGAAMTPVTPAEVGRYTYTYTIPTTFSDGDMLYAEVEAEQAGGGGGGGGNNTIIQSQEVVLIASTRSGVNSSRLTARFVQGG